jgi:glutathione peroxidase
LAFPQLPFQGLDRPNINVQERNIRVEMQWYKHSLFTRRFSAGPAFQQFIMEIRVHLCHRFPNLHQAMTIKQKALHVLYPLFIRATKWAGKNSKILRNRKGVKPTSSIYDLHFKTLSGEEIPMSRFKGKKILFVNTASECGYTAQYAELQQLHLQAGDKLVVLGFPANDFGAQESGSNEEIGQFCTRNFGVTFPLAQKSVVISSDEQNPVYKWLTSEQMNGWNSHAPSWNFSKYLLDEEGTLTHYFDPSISPMAIGKEAVAS